MLKPTLQQMFQHQNEHAVCYGAIKPLLIFSVLKLSFVSHAHAKTLSNEELRSDLQSAVSLASETELFIGQIDKGRLLPRFQSVHANYLRSTAMRLVSELHESFPGSGATRIISTCAEQLESLAHELALIGTMSRNSEALPKARKRVEAIKGSIITVKAGL